MTIGITGASGQMGQALLRCALDRAAPGDVVALTRSAEKLAAFASRGVNVRAADFSDPAGLSEAFRSIERLVLIPTTELRPGMRIGQHTAAINAAVEAGVRHIIYISTVSPRPDANNSLLDSHFSTEQALIASGADWTILRMSVFMDTLADPARRAAASGAYAAVPGAPAAYVLRDDIAAAAAGILCTPGHAGITYHATGPASVTHAEIAAAIAQSAGKPVAFSAMTAEKHRAGLEAAKLPPFVIEVIAGFQAALRAGAFDLVTGDVERLAGRPAQALHQFFSGILRSDAAAC